MALTEEQKAELEQNGTLPPKRRGRPPMGETAPQNAENIGSSVDVAPKARARAASGKAELERIRTSLQTFLLAGGALVGKLNAFDGSCIVTGTPNLVDALVKLCEEDKNVRKLFLSMTVGGAYVNVGVALFSIVLPIMLNHNLLPPLSFPGKTRETAADN